MERAPAKANRLWMVGLVCLVASLANAFVLVPSYSDLRPVWAGTRALILHGVSPYDESVTAENSREFHEATKEHPQYDLRFAYPLHSVYLFAPFAVMPFWWARLVATVAGFVLCLMSLKWWTGLFRVDYGLLLLAAYPVMLGIEIQQPTILFAGILAAGIYFMREERPVLAGLMFALATGKPQLVACVTLPSVLWLCGDWKRRRTFLVSFAAVAGVLIAVSLMMEPGWPGEWMRALRVYSTYAGDSLMKGLFGGAAGVVVSAGLLLIAVAACWKGRGSFQQMLAISIATFLLIMPFQAYNEVLLVVPVVWMESFAKRDEAAVRVPVFLTLLGLASIFLPVLVGAPLEAVFAGAKSPLQMILGGFSRILPVVVYVSVAWVTAWCFFGAAEEVSSDSAQVVAVK